jgi:hypothetical protein
VYFISNSPHKMYCLRCVWSFRDCSPVKDWHLPVKLSKNGPENSKHIVRPARSPAPRSGAATTAAPAAGSSAVVRPYAPPPHPVPSRLVHPISSPPPILPAPTFHPAKASSSVSLQLVCVWQFTVSLSDSSPLSPPAQPARRRSSGCRATSPTRSRTRCQPAPHPPPPARPSHPITSHPIPSHPITSRPVPSRPIPSHVQ